MIRLVTRGRLTQNYAKGLLAKPEDREPVIRKLIEAAGGKFINFYFTTGDSDFLLISRVPGSGVTRRSKTRASAPSVAL
jgi:uncharacterized protein with GYD domain